MYLRLIGSKEHGLQLLLEPSELNVHILVALARRYDRLERHDEAVPFDKHPTLRKRQEGLLA